MVITFKQRVYSSMLPRMGNKPDYLKANIAKRKEIARLIEKGKTYEEIADMVGIKREEVAQYARRLGLRSENKPKGRKKNKAGYRVEYKKAKDKFEAWSTLRDKREYIGTYETEIEAKTAAIMYNMKITKKVIDS